MHDRKVANTYIYTRGYRKVELHSYRQTYIKGLYLYIRSYVASYTANTYWGSYNNSI